MTLAPIERERTHSGEVVRSVAGVSALVISTITAASGLLGVPVFGYAQTGTVSPTFVQSRPADVSEAALWLSLDAIAVPAEEKVNSDQDEVKWVKEHSGLTWDQLGKVFGVSRRAVHMWANGGRMNEANAQSLRDFAAAVRQVLGITPDDTRAALLTHGPGGVSLVDTFRRAQVRAAGESWGTPFTADEKIDVVRDSGAADA